MQLSERLEKVAKTVSVGNSVADIGCDHAYTSIYLMKNKIASKVIAMDVRKGPLEKAKENIEKYGYKDIIETRLSDGAKNLKKAEVDTIVISGMGGALTRKILRDSEEIVKTMNELVLQPQSEVYLVRNYIRELGFNILQEDMLVEEGKYYVIIKAVKGSNKSNNNYVYDLYGEYLLVNKNAVLKQYLQKELKTNEELLKLLSRDINDNTPSKKISRIEELKETYKFVQEGLSYYEM